MQPFEAREAFFLLDLALVALIGRSGKSCRKGMWLLDRAFEQAEVAEVVPIGETRVGRDNARALLRARCGLCPNRCKEPLT